MIKCRTPIPRYKATYIVKKRLTMKQATSAVINIALFFAVPSMVLVESLADLGIPASSLGEAMVEGDRGLPAQFTP